MLNKGSVDFVKKSDDYQKELEAFAKFKEAREKCETAYFAMRNAEKDLKEKKQVKYKEFKIIDEQRKQHMKYWHDYEELLNRNDPKINALDAEKEDAFERMKKCFELEKKSREINNEPDAIGWHKLAKRYQKRYYFIKEEIRQLCGEATEKRGETEQNAQKIDPTAYRMAKKAFNEADKLYKEKLAEFNALREERNRLKGEYDRLRAERIHGTKASDS